MVPLDEERTMHRHISRVPLAVMIAALALMALAGCTGPSAGGGATTPPASSGGAAGSATVVEKNYSFTPNSLNVNVGDVVTFTNQDSVAHDVSINGQDLGNQAPGQSVTWTAATAGTFPFSCLIHPSMTGQVTVGSGTGAAAPPASGGNSGSNPPPATGYGY